VLGALVKVGRKITVALVLVLVSGFMGARRFGGCQTVLQDQHQDGLAKSAMTDIEQDLAVISQRAEAGDAYYQAVLGAIYRRGERGETNMMEAMKWLELSAKQDNPLGLYHFAVLYDIGVIVPGDTMLEKALHAKALPGLTELAEAGNPRAQLCLGTLYEAGLAVKEDIAAANSLYEKAAERGFPVAQYVLGYQYYHGVGFDKDPSVGLEWVRKAAEGGYPAAQHFLGNVYVKCSGVQPGDDRAVVWFRRAENHRYDEGHWWKPGDVVIPGLPPPRFKLEIPHGSCGEACLWSVINSDSFRATQIEVNIAGGNPGRGLHSSELHCVLDHYGVECIDRMNRSALAYVLGLVNLFRSRKHYEKFLYDTVIANIKEGNPVLLGVKIFPNRHFFWDCDHFVLVVGVNEETNELIYNDFNQRKRIDADKLLDRSDGYSLRNKYGTLNAIVFPNFGRVVER
jgi:TPR repeat protein